MQEGDREYGTTMSCILCLTILKSIIINIKKTAMPCQVERMSEERISKRTLKGKTEGGWNATKSWKDLLMKSANCFCEYQIGRCCPGTEMSGNLKFRRQVPIQTVVPVMMI